MSSEIAPSGLPRIKACLFDMDGLLINSEDLYTLCVNEVLHEFGRPPLPWSVKARLQGRPGPFATAIFEQWAKLPISNDEFNQKIRTLHEKHFPTTDPLPGVIDLLKNLKSTKGENKVEIAVATSSHARNFELKSSHLPEIFGLFDKRNIVLGDDPRVAEGRGKPAPDIYLLALQTVNDRRKSEDPSAVEIHPEECLVFEDAVPGVEAGRRAGMQVAWIPHAGLLGEFKGREPEVLAGLTGEHVESTDEKSQKERMEWEAKKEECVKSGRKFARVRGKPGEIDDGWAKLYSTMEDFPYNFYGMKI